MPIYEIETDNGVEEIFCHRPVKGGLVEINGEMRKKLMPSSVLAAHGFDHPDESKSRMCNVMNKIYEKGWRKGKNDYTPEQTKKIWGL